MVSDMELSAKPSAIPDLRPAVPAEVWQKLITMWICCCIARCHPAHSQVADRQEGSSRRGSL